MTGVQTCALPIFQEEFHTRGHNEPDDEPISVFSDEISEEEKLNIILIALSLNRSVVFLNDQQPHLRKQVYCQYTQTAYKSGSIPVQKMQCSGAPSFPYVLFFYREIVL